jgi:hypothetical protein
MGWTQEHPSKKPSFTTRDDGSRRRGEHTRQTGLLKCQVIFSCCRCRCRCGCRCPCPCPCPCIVLSCCVAVLSFFRLVAVLCVVLCCLVLGCVVLYCAVSSCLALSCVVLCCRVFCLVLSRLVFSCPVDRPALIMVAFSQLHSNGSVLWHCVGLSLPVVGL